MLQYTMPSQMREGTGGALQYSSDAEEKRSVKLVGKKKKKMPRKEEWRKLYELEMGERGIRIGLDDFLLLLSPRRKIRMV